MYALVFSILSYKPNAVELELAQWTAVSLFVRVVFCFSSGNLTLYSSDSISTLVYDDQLDRVRLSFLQQ